MQRSVFTKLAVMAVVAFGLVAQSQAADANPTGTWSWTMAGRDGGEGRKTTLTLKAEGEKLTGKIAAPGRQGGQGRDIEIKDGKVKGDEISFTVSRDVGGNTFTQKYTGKVSGDTIKGKIEFDRGGETRSRDWEAKRETEKKS